jgi:hypothetical protein
MWSGGKGSVGLARLLVLERASLLVGCVLLFGRAERVGVQCARGYTEPIQELRVAKPSAVVAHVNDLQSAQPTLQQQFATSIPRSRVWLP